MEENLESLTKTALIGKLENLRDEIRELTASLDEKNFWTRPLNPGNSAGHLVLHLTGNLSHFIGSHLGQSGYVRDREREFTEDQPPSKEAALARLDDAIGLFRRIVSGLGAEQLTAPYPEKRFGSVLECLVHLVAHFSLHRGQISYIVRLVNAPQG